MMLGDTYLNLSTVALVVVEDPTTVTVHFAFGQGADTKFHTGPVAKAQIDRLLEVLHSSARSRFEPLKDGKEYLNLAWVTRGKLSGGEMTVEIVNIGPRTYVGQDAKTLAMRLM